MDTVASRRRRGCDVDIPRRRVAATARYVREHGVDQFIAMWQRSQKLERNDDLVWGDEIEYAVLKVEEERARCVLRGPEIRDELAAKEDDHAYRVEGCAWHPEYGRWMIEGTPRRPCFRRADTSLMNRGGAAAASMRL